MAVGVQSVVFAGSLLAAVAHRSQQPFQPRQPDNWLLPSLVDGGNISSEEEEREQKKRRCAQQRDWFFNRRYRLKFHCVKCFRFPCERRADHSPRKPPLRTEATAPLLFLLHQSGKAGSFFLLPLSLPLPLK
uniref:Putative secreted protein n=1 Tax=Ixodes ricinus TaxID=34613 RepID=A0A6B0URX3_IXORI